MLLEQINKFSKDIYSIYRNLLCFNIVIMKYQEQMAKSYLENMHRAKGIMFPIFKPCYKTIVWEHVRAQSLQSCLTLCNPMGCNPSGSSVHGILQERILECVAMPSSRGSS